MPFMLNPSLLAELIFLPGPVYTASVCGQSAGRSTVLMTGSSLTTAKSKSR
jgi:hypothetical protein